MSFAEIVAIVKDFLLGAAAAITGTAAIVGLKSWSRELRGKTEFEAARNLIKTTYKVRDEIRYCRSPLISAGEFPPDYPGPGQGVSARQEAQAWNHVYGRRWEPVRQALQDLETHALEAEALWGGEIRQKVDQLRQCASELQVAIEAVIEDKAQGGETFKADRNFGKSMRGIVAASHSDATNPLSKKIQATIDGIENEVRPHLRRR